VGSNPTGGIYRSMRKILMLLLIVLSLSGFAWYKTQIGTGIGNCGPASVAMAIDWAYQRNKVSVEEVRSIIGYKTLDGTTSLLELKSALDYHRVKNIGVVVTTLDELKKFVGRRSSFITSIRTGYITNRKYSYNGGHFILVTGVYKDFFIVQDPLGGEDQMYSIKEVWNAMEYKNIILVSR
jgi:hypothetical protein